MSRGPGKWQRAILARLQTQERYFLQEILPLAVIFDERSRSAQRALIRAAHRLADKGLITLDATRRGWNHWYDAGARVIRLNGLIVARAGTAIDRETMLATYDPSRVRRFVHTYTPRA
jgi:hypothetical protein